MTHARHEASVNKFPLLLLIDVCNNKASRLRGVPEAVDL